MMPILNLGPLAIQTPGIIILLGIYIVFIVIEKYSPKFNLPANDISNIIFWTLIAAILFARLAYIIQFPASFLKTPSAILSLNLSLFDPVSGLVFSTILMVIFIRKKKLPLFSVLDNFSPGLSIFFSFYFISLFASGDYYGFPTSLPWGIPLWGTIRHPLQLYYLAGSLIINFIIFRLLKKEKAPGYLFFNFVSLQSIEFIILDFFRGDNKLLLGSLHLTQVIALSFLILSIVFLFQLVKKYENRTDINVRFESSD